MKDSQKRRRVSEVSKWRVAASVYRRLGQREQRGRSQDGIGRNATHLVLTARLASSRSPQCLRANTQCNEDETGTLAACDHVRSRRCASFYDENVTVAAAEPTKASASMLTSSSDRVISATAEGSVFFCGSTDRPAKSQIDASRERDIIWNRSWVTWASSPSSL